MRADVRRAFKFVYAQMSCDLGLAVCCFAQDVNLVSLFQGKLLWFSHSNAPFDLVVKRELRKLLQPALLIYIKSCVSNLKARRIWKRIS